MGTDAAGGSARQPLTRGPAGERSRRVERVGQVRIEFGAEPTDVVMVHGTGPGQPVRQRTVSWVAPAL